MTDKLKPMDMYADMSVPFDVAAYCRGHKFSPEAVRLTKALKARKEAEAHLALAEGLLDRARDDVRDACAQARVRMENDQHA